MDILDYLQADQDALRSLIFDLRVAEENSTEEAATFTALVSLAKIQMEAQETVLRPLSLGSSALGENIRQYLDRNRGARDVEAIIECCTNKTTWRSSVNIYCELLDTRSSKDSRELFATIFESLRAKEREKLGSTYKKLRGFTSQDSAAPIDWRKLWEFILSA